MHPHNGIELIDHPVIAARDLDAARRTFERLGFTVPPRGSHIEWGTGNLCIMFPDDYIKFAASSMRAVSRCTWTNISMPIARA